MHPDPTMTLPVVLGFLTMANVESGNWVMNAAEREQQRQIAEQESKRVAEGGKPRLHPGKVLKTLLRGLSIVRIIIAAITPGVKSIYHLSYGSGAHLTSLECCTLLGYLSRIWSYTDMGDGVEGCPSTKARCKSTKSYTKKTKQNESIKFVVPLG